MTGELPSHIPLPNLERSKFEVVSADIAVIGSVDAIQPELYMSDEEDFTYRFERGVLTLGEDSTDINIQTGNSSIVIRGSHVSNSTFMVNGMTVVGGREKSKARTAHLVLPRDCRADHSIKTVSGSIKAEGLRGRWLNLAATSGDVALKGCGVTDDLEVRTTSGDIEIEETTARIAFVKSTSGNIRVYNSRTEVWRMKTTSGDIRTKEVSGQIEARSTSGRIRS